MIFFIVIIDYCYFIDQQLAWQESLQKAYIYFPDEWQK